MPTYCFTFGGAHTLTDGTPLKDRYCPVEAETEIAARVALSAVRGSVWAFCYGSPEDAGAERWNLHPIALSELTPQPPDHYDD